MPWTQISCQYDGTYPGFLSCVFDCYVNREEPVEFHAPEDICCSLYPLRQVETTPGGSFAPSPSSGQRDSGWRCGPFSPACPIKSCGCGGFSGWPTNRGLR